jgi:DNA-binding XRE family transcriptional regulator
MRNLPDGQGGTAERTRSFPATPAAVADIKRFIGEQLGGRPAERPLALDVATAVSEAARSATGDPAEVRVRIYSDHVEVSVGAPQAGRSGSFSAWLSETLRAEGLSQEAAARRIGVSLKTVNRWVRGHTEPRMRELRRLEAAFGSPPLA